jgi:hypothetical protein
MPTVATSPADLLSTISGSAHLDGDRLVIDDETAFRGRGDDRRCGMARLGGEPGTRGALGEHPGAV